MANIEFVIPSVLNKGMGEKKISLEAHDLHEAFANVSDMLGDDFKRRVFDLNGKPRALINIYINGKNMRFNSDGMSTLLKDGDSLYILPAVAGGAELTSEDMQRFSRQIMLEEIGFVGMEKLRDAKVCVVGVGGIGNPIVTQLAAMGVGKLKIVDRDVVEISNLHRQHLSLVNKLLYIDLNELSFDKSQMFRNEECSSCGPKKESMKEELVLQAEELIIEELCGRDRGKRTYTVTPSSTVPASINLTGIMKNAESLGYDIKMRGNLGITAISTNASKLSISFLTSGAATIVGAKDEEDALFIYRTFAKEIK